MIVTKALLLFIFIMEFETSESRDCRPLKDCSTFKYMLNRRGRSHKFNRFKVNRILKNNGCGYDPLTNSPKVKCPKGSKIPKEKFTTLSRSSGIINGRRIKHKCDGSLKIHHHHKDNDSDVNVSSIRGRRHLDLIRYLKYREVFRIEVIGNCCWRINERTRLRGRDQFLYAGFDREPDIQPKSLTVVQCAMMYRK